MALATAESTADWIDAAMTFEGRMAADIAVSDIEDPIDAIKAAVLSTEIGDTIALQDRNHHEHHWREIYLCRMEHDKWRLSDVNHFDLDENEDGCPFSGFSTESILADIGMHFYATVDVQAYIHAAVRAERSSADESDTEDAVPPHCGSPSVRRRFTEWDAAGAGAVFPHCAKAAALANRSHLHRYSPPQPPRNHHRRPLLQSPLSPPRPRRRRFGCRPPRRLGRRHRPQRFSPLATSIAAPSFLGRR